MLQAAGDLLRAQSLQQQLGRQFCGPYSSRAWSGVGCRFSSKAVPTVIGHVLIVHREPLSTLTIEVQAELSLVTVCPIALASSLGVRCVLRDTGNRTMVFVGDAMLGYVFYALGEPVDGGLMLADGERCPMYGAPRQLTKQQAVVAPFLSKIEAPDMLVPLPHGGD